MHHSITNGLNKLNGSVGIANGMAKLTALNVFDILYDTDRISIIAKKYNISPSTVCAIRSGRSWTHITKLKKLKKTKFKGENYVYIQVQ